MATLQELKRCLDQTLDHVGDPACVPLLEQFRQLYQQLDQTQRIDLFRMLAFDFESPGLLTTDAQPSSLIDDLQKLLTSRLDLNDASAVQQLMQLRDRLESPRQAVLRELVNLPDGIGFLVRLRADMLDLQKQHPQSPWFKLVDADMLHLLRSWFHTGFLRLVPINWQITPAAQLEKLMAGDVVHPMSDWSDLRRRLQKDRLCFAFYHSNMPHDPLIFVEVALTRSIVSSIDRLFDPSKQIEDIDQTTTALFYSINAMQKGLAGVNLGNSLIKMVVGELRRCYPNLRRFATLSPAPGFRGRYLEPLLADDPRAARFALRREELPSFFDAPDLDLITRAGGNSEPLQALRHLLARDDWASDNALRLALKPGLLRLMHHYITREKQGRDPLNPVANFHLKNGAVLYNINFLSNTSPKGMAESYGLTVNYHYDLDHIARNQQLTRSGQCPVSPQLEKLLSFGASA